MLLWLLVIALIIFAVAGGAALNSFLWLLLIVAVSGARVVRRTRAGTRRR